MSARLEVLLQRMAARGDDEALINGGESTSFQDLEQRRLRWLELLDGKGIRAGTVLGLKARHSADAVSLLLALTSRGCVVALVPYAAMDDEAYLEDACATGVFHLSEPGSWTFASRSAGDHPMLRRLRESGGAGFVVFSSGSTGRPKAVLHGLESFLVKFERPLKRLRTLAFLLFDHIAGADTLFYSLASGGTLVVPAGLDPRSVCAAIEDHGVEVLPASPTFLNLLCLSGDHANFDLSSLKIVTYGSEPMSPTTLERIGEILPRAELIQKYGTSELGSPRSLSRGRDSLFLKLKSDETEAKIVDGILWLRSPGAMIGYLNAPSPFDEEGWYCTGDRVETDGEWIRFAGRASEVIVVGGEKVHPSEVEQALLELDFVQDVLVHGEQHPMTGQIVTACVNLTEARDERQVRREIRRHCRARLEPHKVPARVEISATPLVTERQKKIRRAKA